jgi:hypothetical protein
MKGNPASITAPAAASSPLRIDRIHAKKTEAQTPDNHWNSDCERQRALRKVKTERV